jgi:PAS domain S-box-containing protein
MKWNTAPFFKDRSWVVAWPAVAMLALIALSLGGMRDLLRANLPGDVRIAHTLVVFLTLLLFALLVLVVDYLTKRELLSEARLAHEHLRMAMVAGKAVAWDLDVRTGRVQWLGDLQRMFGISADSFSGQAKDFYRYVHPEDRQRVSAAVANARANREPYVAEFRVVWEDGTLRWVRATGKFLYSKKDDAERMLGTAVDITDQQRVSEALVKSEERFSRAFRGGPMAMTLTSARDHRYLDINEAFERLTGWSRDEVIGRTPFDIRIWVEPTDREEFVKATLANGSTRNLEVRYRCKSGEERVGLASAEIMEIEGETCILSAMIDITDRKNAEDALRRKDAELGEAQRLAQLGSWQWDPKTRMLTWSEGLYRIHGLDPKLPPPSVQELQRLLTPESWEQLSADMAIAAEAGTVRTLDLELRRLDGTHRWVTARGEALRNSAGDVISFRGTVQDITERKLFSDRLQASEARLSGVINSAMDAILAIDEEQHIVLFNSAAEKMFGCSAREALGTPVEHFIPNGFRSEQEEHVWRFHEARTIDRTTSALKSLWAKRSSGENFPIEAAISKVKEDGKKLVTVIIRDVTERRRAEEKLHDSEERFRRLVEHIGEALVVDDVNGRVVFANDRFLSLFGFHREELQNITQEDYIGPEYIAKLPDRHAGQMRGEAMVRHYEYEGFRRDGSKLWVDAEVVPIKGPGGAIIGTQKLLRDITDRKRAEQALRESEERFRLVANTAPVMIWMSGTDKLCTYFNKPWLDFSGRTLEAELGNGWADGVYSEDLDRCLATYTEAFDRRESFKMEYRLRRSDGEYRWILDIGEPRFNLDNSFAGYIGSALDVTDRKLAEEALATMGRRLIEAHEEERSRIGRELHDDINQRLALLAVELDRWNQQSTSGPEIHERVEDAQQRIVEIARDVQGLSHRLHSSKLEYLGLAAAANSFCRELSQTNMVNVRFHQTDIPRTLPKEVSLCLFRVLQEALQNAVKHSGVRDFNVELHGRADEIELTITDAGVGFDVDEGMNRRGLGLISMRERLQLVNGEFTVSSKIGQGTTIHARVPLKAQPFIQNMAG